MSRSDPARALLDAIIALYESRPSGDHGAGPMLETVCLRLKAATPSMPPPAPRTIAASSLLSAALPDTAVAAAVKQATALLRWRQNPNYSVANMGAAFMAAYGYVEFAGPQEAMFHAPDIRVGLLLLGPGLHYPPHAHPAEEIYHPLTAGGLWRRNGESWRSVPVGYGIHHAPMIVHETKATERTLLALYCWCGETRTEARLTA